MADPQPTLEEQVAAGARRLDDAARVRNAADDARIGEVRRRRDRDLARACAPVNRLDAYGVVWFTYAVIAVAALFFWEQRAARGTWALFGAIAGSYLLGLLLVRLHARRRDAATLAAERAWVLALPFRLVAYEDLFVEERLRRTRWHVRLVFAGEPPPSDTLRALFAVVAPDPTVHVRDGRADVTLPFPARDDDLAASYRFRLRLLFHRTVDECLRPLHAKHPLVSVAPRLDDRWEG